MNVSSQFLFNELKNQLDSLKQQILAVEADFDQKVADGTIGGGKVTWIGTDGKTYKTKIPETNGTINIFDSVNKIYPVEIVDWGKSDNILEIEIGLGGSSLKKVPPKAPAWTKTFFKLFYGQRNFNDPNIIYWDTSHVTSMQRMFSEASSFNQPIGNWNTSKVGNMWGMFSEASSFNQPIGNWNTSKVYTMLGMFEGASSFNQPIGNWNTSNVMNMNSMFKYATSFNQNLSQWCVRLITTKPSRFDYDATNWTLPRPVWGTCPRGENEK